MTLIDSNTELNKNLRAIKSNGAYNLQRVDQNESNCLPGQARVLLENEPLKKYLRDAFSVPNLDKMAPYLWLVCSQLKAN
jgi:hypothetical protein